MTTQKRIFFDLWYQEDEVSEWYEDYLRALELWMELSKLHSGLRCDNTIGNKCTVCTKVTKNPWEGQRLLGIINEYEVTENEPKTVLGAIRRRQQKDFRPVIQTPKPGEPLAGMM